MTTNEQYHADPAISASHLKAISDAVALSLLEPVPRSAAPNGGAFERNASGQPWRIAQCWSLMS
jgi:hypothetical protein